MVHLMAVNARAVLMSSSYEQRRSKGRAKAPRAVRHVFVHPHLRTVHTLSPTGQDDGLLEAAQHERQRRGRVGQRVSAVNHLGGREGEREEEQGPVRGQDGRDRARLSGGALTAQLRTSCPNHLSLSPSLTSPLPPSLSLPRSLTL